MHPHKALTTVAAALLTCLAAGSCSTGTSKDDDAAARAAKEYYDSLNAGGYEYFATRYQLPERIAPNYKQQLTANARMYIDGMRKEHKGLAEVRVLSCKNDSLSPTAEAYLLLAFADSVSEEIVVPMVKVGDEWLMR